MADTAKNLIYPALLDSKQAGKKKLAILIDPDKVRLGNLDRTLKASIDAGVNYFFIGGSLIVNNMLDHCLDIIKEAVQKADSIITDLMRLSVQLEPRQPTGEHRTAAY